MYMAHQRGNVQAIKWIILGVGLPGEHLNLGIIVFCVGPGGFDGDTGRLAQLQLPHEPVFALVGSNLRGSQAA